jgi:hypothetical protein
MKGGSYESTVALMVHWYLLTSILGLREVIGTSVPGINGSPGSSQSKLKMTGSGPIPTLRPIEFLPVR